MSLVMSDRTVSIDGLREMAAIIGRGGKVEFDEQTLAQFKGALPELKRMMGGEVPRERKRSRWWPF